MQRERLSEGAKNPSFQKQEGRAKRQRTMRYDRVPAPPCEGFDYRARTELVSWLEAVSLAFPDRPIQWRLSGLHGSWTVARFEFRTGLLQWRGRAGFAPDFRKGPVRLCEVKVNGGCGLGQVLKDYADFRSDYADYLRSAIRLINAGSFGS